MGFIDYKHEGGQVRQATVYDESHKNVVCRASLAFNGSHWELSPKSCPDRDIILRALDSHNIYF